MRQILWGLFKKIVIADNCAEYVNLIFNNSLDYSGVTLVLGAVFFSFQIYGDFSGYSDIAIGTARLFGIDLIQNFAFPYFSRDIAEFWRRWHISLSTWFRDYVYIPIGGSNGSSWIKIRNTLIIFLLSGLWHGANWTFIAWGMVNAICFLPLLLTNRNRRNIRVVAEGRNIPSFKELLSILLTFSLTTFAWIFFRSENIKQAIQYIADIFKNPSSFISFAIYWKYKTIILLIFIFILIEWKGRDEKYAIAQLGIKWKRPLRIALYYVIIITIFLLGGKTGQFIYFQF